MSSESSQQPAGPASSSSDVPAAGGAPTKARYVPPAKRGILSLGALTKKLDETSIASNETTPQHVKSPLSSSSAASAASSSSAGAYSSQPSTTSANSSNSNQRPTKTRSNPYHSNSGGGTTSAASASPSPSPTLSPPSSSLSASPPPTSTTPQPRKQGLIIDRARQDAIDAQFMAQGADIGTKREKVDPACLVECYDLIDAAASQSHFTANTKILATHIIDQSHLLLVLDTPTRADRLIHDYSTSSSSSTAASSASASSETFKLRKFSHASDASRALGCTLLAPSRPRPKTDSGAANRLLAGALGIRMPGRSAEAKEEERIRKEERKKLLEERERRKEQENNSSNNSRATSSDSWD